MTNASFIVVCTSCESVLEVRNPGLVGQIVACPKCGSMVLIEPTSQTRDRLQASGSGLQEEQASSEFQGSDTKPEGQYQKPEVFSLEESQIPKPEAQSLETETQIDIDELFGPVATELQAEYLNDVVLDSWQKRRLVIVAVGTICLLTTFVAFLWFWYQATNANLEVRSPESEITSVEPPPADGIVASQIGGQPDVPSSPKAADHQQDNITPLPSADEIKVEGQPAPDESPSDTTGNQNDADQNGTSEFKIEPTQPGLPQPSQSNPGQSGASVRVTGPLIEPSDDPFDDIDNSIVIDKNPKTETSGGDNNSLDETIDDTADVTGGFADFFGIGSLSSIVPSEPEITEPDDDAGVTLPETDIEPEITEPEIIESVEIDIDERLTLAVASIQFVKTPIVEVVRTLSNISDVPMQLDIDELRARGISIEAPMTLQSQEPTIAGIINAVMQKTKLTRHDGNGYLVFGYSDEQVNALRTARYDMSRLALLEQNPISAEQAAQWLSELLVNQPHNPKAAHATVVVDGHEVVVVGTVWLQDQARRLLLSLFYLRDLEPENGMPPERLAPEVFGWDRINAPLSLNLVEPIPLKKAAQLIEGHTKMRVLIDHAALRDEGLSQETLVESRISHGTIDTVLCGMLEPPGLTYRIVEANAVEITTPRVAREKMTIEAHRFAPLTDGKTPESCAETMRQAFGGETSWNLEIGGVIVIDPVSGYMLVRQSQPLQRDIRLWFGQMHNEETVSE